MKRLLSEIALLVSIVWHPTVSATSGSGECPRTMIAIDTALESQLAKLDRQFSVSLEKDGKVQLLEYESKQPCLLREVGWVLLSGAAKVTERDGVVDSFTYDYTYANVDSACIAGNSKCRADSPNKTAVWDMDIQEARRIVAFLRNERRRDLPESTYSSFFFDANTPLSVNQYEVRRFEVNYVAANRTSYVRVKVERDGLGKFHVIGVSRNPIERPR